MWLQGLQRVELPADLNTRCDVKYRPVCRFGQQFRAKSAGYLFCCKLSRFLSRTESWNSLCGLSKSLRSTGGRLFPCNIAVMQKNTAILRRFWEIQRLFNPCTRVRIRDAIMDNWCFRVFTRSKLRLGLRFFPASQPYFRRPIFDDQNPSPNDTALPDACHDPGNRLPGDGSAFCFRA